MFKKVNGECTQCFSGIWTLSALLRFQQNAHSRSGSLRRGLSCLLCKLGFFVCAARERIVGWYSTGPRLREADLSITDLLTVFVEVPLLVICEVEVNLKAVAVLLHTSSMQISFEQVLRPSWTAVAGLACCLAPIAADTSSAV